MINISDFQKLELKVGTVVVAEVVEGSEKLIKLTVDFNEEDTRTILTGMKQWKTPEDFKEKQLVFVTNLEPRMIMGIESQGMIMAVDGGEDSPVFLVPETEVPNGSKIR